MKFCIHCGSQTDDDSAFCPNCGANMAAEQSEPAPAPDQAPAPAPAKAKRAGKLVQRGKEFEAKHHIIVNALIAVCAIVVLFVSLFAPIKTVNYANDDLVYIDSIDEDDNETSYSFVEIDQSIFQMIGSLFYISPSDEDKVEIMTEVYAAAAAATQEYSRWLSTHPTATTEEKQNKQCDIIAEHLSDINVGGYMLVSSDAQNEESFSSTYYGALVSVIFGAIVSLISIAAACYSLYYLIFAISGMATKKTKLDPFKYLGRILLLCSTQFGFLFAGPMLKAGGGVFAVALFTAIAYVAIAVAQALILKTSSVRTVIKNTVVATLSVVAFFLLCSNVFSMRTYPATGKGCTSVSGPTGYGLQSMLEGVSYIEDSEYMAYIMGAMVTGSIFYLVACSFTATYAFKAVRHSVQRMTKGQSEKAPGTSMMTAAISALILIIFGFFSHNVAAAISESILEGSSEGVTIKWIMNVQMWLSMIFFIAAFVFDKVFKAPEVTAPAAAAPAPEAAPAPASVPEANTVVAPASAPQQPAADTAVAPDPFDSEPTESVDATPEIF